MTKISTHKISPKFSKSTHKICLKKLSKISVFSKVYGQSAYIVFFSIWREDEGDVELILGAFYFHQTWRFHRFKKYIERGSFPALPAFPGQILIENLVFLARWFGTNKLSFGDFESTCILSRIFLNFPLFCSRPDLEINVLRSADSLDLFPGLWVFSN